jgi:hypothetical protein
MKKIYTLAGSFLLLVTGTAALAQDCKSMLPFTQGAEFETKTFNEKDKVQSSSKQKVTQSSGTEATINAESFDDKGKSLGASSYTITCSNGSIRVDMKSMLDPKVMSGYKDMDVKIEADHLDYPADAAVGKQLEDGMLSMTVNGPFPMNNTIKITNRKVEGKETITTPAGTFECIKITYDEEIKFLIKVTARVEEWYSKDVGSVQSKVYNSKGKLQTYTQLTSMKK